MLQKKKVHKPPPIFLKKKNSHRRTSTTHTITKFSTEFACVLPYLFIYFKKTHRRTG
eukprot:SAG11_NODE_37437_length_257_cov_0.506329_1_plen_56_part_10